MADSLHIFQPAYQFVDSKLDVFLNERASSVMAQVSGPLRAALVLYVLLYGVAILRGAIQEPFMDFVVRSIKLAFIYMLATTVAYSTYITQPLFHVLPDTLTQAISGSGVPDVGSAFDQFFARAAYLAEKIWNKATPVNFAPLILSAVVYIVGALAAAIGFGGVALLAVQGEVRRIGVNVNQIARALNTAVMEGKVLDLEVAYLADLQIELRAHMSALRGAFEGNLAYWAAEP